MSELEITKGSYADIPQVLALFDTARKFMRANGNQTQWNGVYPAGEDVISDIENNCLYMVRQNGQTCGTFAFVIGEDPSYAYIEDGAWLSDAPYGTIHRIASDGKAHGIFDAAIAYCEKILPHMRIDTHADNLVMNHAALKNGFRRCGIVYMEDGSPRTAYEKV